MKPRVLLLYYSFTQQTSRVAAAMADAFGECGFETEQCPIEFVDQRYPLSLPFKPFWRKLLRWVIPQTLGKTGEIRVSRELLDRDYDLICIGSPTWWVNPAMPVVSFLKSDAARNLLNGKNFAVFAVCRKLWWNNLRNVRKLAAKQGGTFVQGAGFCFLGNQVQSALSFIDYMQTNSNRDRYWGVRIYEFGIPAEGLEQARMFARELAEGIAASK